LENYPARKCRLVHVSFCGSATEHSVEELPYLFRDFDPEWGSGRLAAVQLPELEDYRQFFVVWDHADEIDDANGCGFYNSAGPQAWATLAPSSMSFRRTHAATWCVQDCVPALTSITSCLLSPRVRRLPEWCRRCTSPRRI
jgi:hypothetical protein